MQSLQKALLKSALFSSVLAGSMALYLFALVSVYQTVQMHDQIMDEMADILLTAEVNSQSNVQVDELSEEFHIDYQLTLQQQVLAESEHFHFIKPTTPSFHHEEFEYFWQDGTLWRSYVAERTDQHLQVRILQPLNERFEDVFDHLLSYSCVLMILWCLQGVISYFVIQRQFRPLLQLSKAIQQKNSTDLSAIPSTDYPLLELQPIVLQLNHLLQRLEQALQAEQRFTADASHELRSPLSAMHLRLQVLKRKYQDDALQHDLAVLQQDIQRSTQILENLLLLARLDPTEHEQLPLQVVDLKQLLNEVLQRLHFLSDEKQLNIAVTCTDLILLSVHSELMFSCFRNLMDNAIRYTPSHGKIEITVQEHHDHVIVVIENTGTGLTQELIQHFGERFYRVLGTQTQGSGLGLSICKKIVALHHGEIQFSPSTLGGLKVRLCLFKPIKK